MWPNPKETALHFLCIVGDSMLLKKENNNNNNNNEWYKTKMVSKQNVRIWNKLLRIL